ncbi:MAG: hypothetical protein AAF916_08640 [Planctomycetota bacterium]
MRILRPESNMPNAEASHRPFAALLFVAGLSWTLALYGVAEAPPTSGTQSEQPEQAEPADPGATLLGRLAGTWHLNATRASGESITARSTYTPTLDCGALRVVTYVTTPDGSTYQRYDRLMWFDPEANQLRTLGLNQNLPVREQSFAVTIKNDLPTLRRGFEDASARSRETYAFRSEATMAWQVEVPSDDEGWNVAVSGIWQKK